MNRLYFGDNLKWLSDRKEFPDASVDLVYLDPPFNSNADYNVLFRERSGAIFSNYCLAGIFSIRYTGISSLVRYVSESP
jgi:DNA modification methylase